MADRFPHQQPPVQGFGTTSEATTPPVVRASPFSSSPVAIVNQARPGFGAPGQFQGHAVRATPTQLSTPLVPQRHKSKTIAGISSDISSPLFDDGHTSHQVGMSDLFGRPSQKEERSAAGVFAQASFPSFQRRQSSLDPFGSPSASTQLQKDLSQVSGVKEKLFSSTLSPQQPNQQDNYQSLFRSPENLSTPSVPTLSRHSSLTSSQIPMHSTLNKFLPNSTQSRASQQCASPRQQSPARSFGHVQPFAAPFLGYTESTRSQYVRSPSTLAMPSDSLIPDTPTSHQVLLKAPSADELIDEFMKIPVDGRFAAFDIAALLPNKLHLEDIPDTLEGLEALYAQKRWKSLTKKSLSMLQKPPSNVDVTLEIKSWWLAGLIKEGHYDNAASVLDQVGNLDGISFSDGVSPFAQIRLYLLQALLSKCQGDFVKYEKQLFHLILRLNSAIQENTTKFLSKVEINVAARWLRTAQFALANHLVYQQKFTQALRICSQIDEKFVNLQEKGIVLSRVGRIRLQMGDLEAAEKLFDAARYCIDQLKEVRGDGSTVTAEVFAALQARLLLNDGLLFFAQNKLQEALSAFDSVLNMHNALTSKADDVDANLFFEEDVVCSAVNNYAICALYCCNVKAAVAALEQTIRSNPKRFLNGVVVFNLSSLYDLLFDNTTSKSRKEMMKKIANMYDLEHVDPATYRI